MLDGPSPAIQALTGMSVARDGSGGLVYVKTVGGVAHVFVSQLAFGSFAAPVEVDSQLPGASSAPVIGAGPGGLLVIAFINGGQLYEVTGTAEPARFSAPRALFAGAINPAVAVTPLGKAYVAFTSTAGGVAQVRAAYYFAGRWGVESSALNANAAENAGAGTGAPAVAASGDGVAIVTWGEAGHVYLRRVWGLAPSTAVYQADVPSLQASSEVSADQPQIATGGDSSYVDVAFQETFTNGSQQNSGVLLRRLRASVWDPVDLVDVLAPPSSSSAAAPRISATDDGIGIVTAAQSDTGQLWAATLTNDGGFGGAQQLDSYPNSGAPYAAPVDSGFKSGLVAWQFTPAPLATPEIVARFYDGTSFSPEQVISPANLGPTDAALGLAVGADFNVDVAVGWVQGAAGAREIVVDQLYQPPGGFSVTPKFRYVRSTQPTLQWSAPPHELWAPLYELIIDGNVAARTAATAIRPPAALTQGPHTWSVEAVNGGGLTSTTKSATVFVDTIPPAVSYKLSGRLQAGSELHLSVSYSDTPPGLPASDGSGVNLVTVDWGDGSKYTIAHGKYHAYKLAGRYRLTIAVTDRAGNVTKQTQIVQIRKPPKRKHKQR
ncbi:MAG TPA: hypothetical protein VG410_02415 [Solirubrobacteraceae bacterium]|nr:hypothetical protein [Solirubrobacteraceae bacterium]